MTTTTITLPVWNIAALVDGERHIYGVWEFNRKGATAALLQHLTAENRDSVIIQNIKRTPRWPTSDGIGAVLRHS